MSNATLTAPLDRIADLVITARHRRRMTQRQLADLAGVAPNTVVRVEAGKAVRDGSLAAVFGVLEIDPHNIADADADAEADTACDIARAFVASGRDANERRARMLHLVRAVGAYSA